MRNVSAQRADLLDEARRDELEAVGGHQKDVFDLGIEAGVHPHHLKLVLEVGNCAQPADDDAGADRLGELHQQGLKGAHLDAFGRLALEQLGDVGADDLNPFVGRKERALAVVARHRDDQPVDNLRGAANDVEMAVGDRVKGAGIDADPRCAHLPSPSSLSAPLVPSAFASSPFSPFSSEATSGNRATDTTRSPSPTRKITTPALPRRTMRISSTEVRITMPPSVTSMIWSLGPTGKTATTASLRRVKSMLLMPCPPRPV